MDKKLCSWSGAPGVLLFRSCLFYACRCGPTVRCESHDPLYGKSDTCHVNPPGQEGGGCWWLAPCLGGAAHGASGWLHRGFLCRILRCEVSKGASIVAGWPRVDIIYPGWPSEPYPASRYMHLPWLARLWANSFSYGGCAYCSRGVVAVLWFLVGPWGGGGLASCMRLVRMWLKALYCWRACEHLPNPCRHPRPGGLSIQPNHTQYSYACVSLTLQVMPGSHSNCDFR